MTNEWEVVVNHRADLLSEDLILTGIYLHANLNDFGASFAYPSIRYDHTNGDIFWPTKQINEMRTKLLNINHYQRLIKRIEDELNEYREYIKVFEQNLARAPKQPEIIIEYFDKSFKPVGNIARFVLEVAIAAELERQGIPEHAIASTRTETSRASEQLTHLAKKYAPEIAKHTAADMADISPELMTELESFCKTYGYLGMKYFLGGPWTTWQAYEMLLHAKEKEPQKAIADPQHASHYVTIAQDLLRLRTETWEVMCYSCFLFRRMITEHFSTQVAYEELLNLRISEVIDILSSRYHPRRLLDTREAFVLEILDTGVTLLQVEKQREITPTFRDNVREIKGLTAQVGKVTGRAKVVLTPKHGYKIESGDILVTTMSTPDFLPAMMRAAAFVTDIGGITSHAAIVSREMKKPCIIGTKVATKILRDDDLIEVDAHTGIIKILN